MPTACFWVFLAKGVSDSRAASAVCTLGFRVLRIPRRFPTTTLQGSHSLCGERNILLRRKLHLSAEAGVLCRLWPGSLGLLGGRGHACVHLDYRWHRCTGEPDTGRWLLSLLPPGGHRNRNQPLKSVIWPWASFRSCLNLMMISC